MENFPLFKLHVDGIHSAARIVIEKQLSKAVWPALKIQDAGEEGWVIEFSEPAILWDAPIRASTRTSLTKRAIVMDGTFYFKDGVFDKGGASLEVYSVERTSGGCNIKLLEAMHFDIEPHARQSPFHPMFHVQFGKSHRWIIEDLQSRFATLARIESTRLYIDRNLEIPTRDVRIPTPQMDYLSMLVMVVADYFCEKNSTHEVTSGFKNLLKKVMDSRNLARNGRQSTRLEKRWIGDSVTPFCASHWYEESCK